MKNDPDLLPVQPMNNNMIMLLLQQLGVLFGSLILPAVGLEHFSSLNYTILPTLMAPLFITAEKIYFPDHYIQIGNTFITVEFENSSSPMIFDRVFKYFTRAFNSLIKKGSPLGFVPSVKSVAFLSKNVFPSQGAHIRVNLSPNIPELNEYRIKNNISEPVELNFIQLQKLPSIYEDQSRFNLLGSTLKAKRYSELNAIREIAKGDPVVEKLIDTYKSSLESKTLLQLENQVMKKYLIEIDDLKEEYEFKLMDMAKENKAQIETLAKENMTMAKKIADLEARLAKAGVK